VAVVAWYEHCCVRRMETTMPLSAVTSDSRRCCCCSTFSYSRRKGAPKDGLVWSDHREGHDVIFFNVCVCVWSDPVFLVCVVDLFSEIVLLKGNDTQSRSFANHARWK
jgi:hypothetical protein